MDVCNVEKLKEIMESKKVSVEALCGSLGMDKSTFYRKIKNQGKGFTVEEVHNICHGLILTAEEAKIIFFNNIVA